MNYKLTEEDMTEEQILETNLEKAQGNISQVATLTKLGIIPNYVSLLFTSLLARAPVRTGRLKSAISLTFSGLEDETVAEIIVAPGVPYARATNEKSNGPKQQYNYKWVNNTVEQVSKVMADTYRKEDDFGYEIL
jgi:hypothetical protein